MLASSGWQHAPPARRSSLAGLGRATRLGVFCAIAIRRAIDCEWGCRDTLAVGQRVTVRVDPEDPHSVLVWSTSPAAPASGGAAGEDERLAKLERLIASGVLTDAEFEAQKAKLLGT
jgi:hypothetical protein